MAKVPHCKYCTKPILDKTQAIKKGNYWYHLDCHEKIKEEKEKNKSDRDKLFDYINKLYNNKIPTFIYVQIADYIKTYNMTYKGMLLCLQYAFEDKGMRFDSSKGVGIIPYLYTECENDWKHQRKIKKAVKEFKFDDEIITVKRNVETNGYLQRKKSEFTMEEV